MESLGGNKYAFDFGGSNAETIAVDGADQPGLSGTTLSVTVEGPDTWKVVRKKDSHMLLTATWKLSQNRITLSDKYTEFRAERVSVHGELSVHANGSRARFWGTWESTIAMLNSALVLQIRPYEGNGLSFIHSSQEVTRNVKFDGKDSPKCGPRRCPRFDVVSAPGGPAALLPTREACVSSVWRS